MSFSEEIKSVRMKAFLSQVSFAEVLHVSFSSVNRWENNKGKPNLSTMREIKAFCIAHDLPYDNLESEWIGNSTKEKNY